MTNATPNRSENDFFVSFTSSDKTWADWIAWTLNDKGYSVIYQPWDFAPGTNFVLQMNKAIQSTQTIAVLSEAYLKANFAQPEWAAAFAADPTGAARRLIPVRIDECKPDESLLAQVVSIDLVGIFDEELAKQTLLAGLAATKPSEAPEFPNSSGKPVPFPGTIADPATRASSPRGNSDLLPPPGIRVPLSPAYAPPIFRGVQVHTDNPLVLDFVLDSGDANLSLRDLGEVALRLTKYFLTALTVPDQHLWVNLSPHEKDAMIPEDLAQTQMGADLLVQDYVLKQVTATATYPEHAIGRTYWAEIYEKTSNHADPSKVDTYNKVWVTPANARIVERGRFAIVEESALRVQTEKDYLATERGRAAESTGASTRLIADELAATEVFKKRILPLLETDVNSGGNFAVLRQIYASLVIALWYKEALRRSVLSDLFIDKGKTGELGYSQEADPEAVYAQYLESFRSGVFEYIREDYAPGTQEIIPRKYFSGGFTYVHTMKVTKRLTARTLDLKPYASEEAGHLYWVRMNLNERDSDLVGEAFYVTDGVGGIDLGMSEDFDFEIAKEGAGLKFDLPVEIKERLEGDGMNSLQPAVMFVKRIVGDRLEISERTSLDEVLEDIKPSPVPELFEIAGLKPASKGNNPRNLASRLRRAWDTLLGREDQSD